MEIYKDMPGYEGFYEVSNYGNVRSLDRVVTYSNGRKARYKGRVRRPSVSEYRLIVISKGNKIKALKISRLVGMLFVDNPDNKPIINHIDGNKHNDNHSNLEWCDYSHNCVHSFENGLSRKRNKVSGVFFEKRRSKWASYLYRDGKNIFCGRFETEKEAIKAREAALNANNKH